MIYNFFKYLRNNNIDFCLTNGYEDVAKEKNLDSDIDIMVGSETFSCINKIISEFCLQENYQLVQVLHHDLGAKNIFLFDPVTSQFLNLDLYNNLSRNNVSFFSEKMIFETLEYYEGIPKLSSEKELVFYLTKKLSKYNLSKDNFSYLLKLYEKGKEISKQVITYYFPSTHKQLIDVFERKNYIKLIDLNKILLSDVETLSKTSYRNKIFNSLRIIKRILKPTGFSIAFLGPDGSGKTTIIEELTNTRLPFRRIDYFHLKPLIVSNKKSNDDVTDPHKYKPYSPIKSYLKLFLFFYQYNKGWFKNIQQLKIKSSLIIFDRYYDDLLIDNKRYRYGGSLFLAKLIRFIIPKPNLYFILTSDAKVIYKRKQEVSFDELRTQLQNYYEMADNAQYLNIDVDQSPNIITKEIITHIMSKMNEKH